MSGISLLHPDELDGAAMSPIAPPEANWLNVVSHLDPKYGGLSAIVPQLCTSIADSTFISIGLAAFCLPQEMWAPKNSAGLPTTFWPTSRSHWMRERELQRSFRELVAQADGVHIHGLWEQSTHIAAKTAKSLGKPYMISAHGMLDPWALANKGWKKRIYAGLRERGSVRDAACLHALTHSEVEDYRRFGARGPIAVIPNAVAIPDRLDPEMFLAHHPAARRRRIVLFLGRLHPKKGLDLLVDAWKPVARQFPEAYLVLAGPDFDGTRKTAEDRIRAHGLSEKVLFTGMLDHVMKWSAFAAAECFVLPSYSEGLSASVLEAMGAGVPVIVTRQCHMPEVSRCAAGREINPEVEELASALAEFLNNSLATNRLMGANGSRLIRKCYSWTAVASQMADVYRWLTGGPIPACVIQQEGGL